MKTTLNQIKLHQPCESGWKKLLKYLGKKHADDEPLSIVTIIESNGLADALWCLRAVEGHDKELILYAVWCARQVQHLMTDKRSIQALDVAERYAHGQATREELLHAADAADDAYFAAEADVSVHIATVRAAQSAARAADVDDICAANSARYCAADAARFAEHVDDSDSIDLIVYRNQRNELVRICQLMEHP